MHCWLLPVFKLDQTCIHSFIGQFNSFFILIWFDLLLCLYGCCNRVVMRLDYLAGSQCFFFVGHRYIEMNWCWPDHDRTYRTLTEWLTDGMGFWTRNAKKKLQPILDSFLRTHADAGIDEWTEAMNAFSSVFFEAEINERK